MLVVYTNDQVPQKAPSIDLKAVMSNGKFQKVSLEDYKDKYVVLLFYPFDFTYVCPTELHAFSDSIDLFTKLDTVVLGISTDSHYTHLAWRKTPRSEGGIGDLKLPLLADVGKTVTKAYGILVEDPQDDMFGAALRGLFIIDGKGIIRSIQINDDHVGRSVHETLRLIEAFKFTDINGEVCPANWKPGQATIKPDQEGKNDFFKFIAEGL